MDGEIVHAPNAVHGAQPDHIITPGVHTAESHSYHRLTLHNDSHPFTTLGWNSMMAHFSSG